MKMGRNVATFIIVCIVFSMFCLPAQPAFAAQISAFPGAEGGGMWTTGARDAEGIEVYHVTSLADDGSYGTFRDAVSKANRIIVFDVAGNISLSRSLTIGKDNLTILGQTSPGDGICFKDYDVNIVGSNVILRYLRFRMGTAGGVEGDSLGSQAATKNVIIDHCSISWCTDECASFYGNNENFTMQWCLVSESLRESIHVKGAHGYGGIWGGINASFHHNLLAHHDSRNPRIDRGGVMEAYNDITATTKLADMRNNVIYNWGGNSAYGGENGMPINIINCYYKTGPATSSSSNTRIYQVSAPTADAEGTDIKGWGTSVYVDGNYMSSSSSVTSNNKNGVVTDGNATKYYVCTSSDITDAQKTVHFRYDKSYPVVTQTAQEAYTSVLASAGASVVRDSVDKRVIEDVKNGTGASGKNGNGLIDSPDDVGGYPTLSGTKSKDTDNDGIPNEWEDLKDLDKYNAADAFAKAESGYMYIEEYANQLASGAYVRDVSYDPNVSDYEPTPTVAPSEDPTATPAPHKELVASWTASAADLSKAAGSELMSGLTLMLQLNSPDTVVVTFDDGLKSSYGITSKTGGKWEADGTASGTALKYTATEDGLLTIYFTGLRTGTDEKVFYVTKEGTGATEYLTDSLRIVPIAENNQPIRCEFDVKAGEVYYLYGAGTKVRFRAAKFERYVAAEDWEITGINGKDVTIKNNVSGEQTTAGGEKYGVYAAVYSSLGTMPLLKSVSFGEVVTAEGVNQYTCTLDTQPILGAGESLKIFMWDSELRPFAVYK